MDRAQLLNDAEAAQRDVLDGRQSTIWTAMPCLVTKVDLTKMTLEAQPAIQGTLLNEDGSTTTVNYPLLVDVPIVFPSAGGFTITFPIAAGDEVLVIFASRCIDAWWQSGGIGRPMEARMHDLSDGFAIPGPKSQPKKISGISSTALQIRNDAGDAYIEIAADGKVKIVSSEFDLVGNLKVTGNIQATGTIVADSLATAISLTNHRHTGVTGGTGFSGDPITP